MTEWFIADTHFGHQNILKHDRRPFVDIEEHDEALIAGWNERVGETDTVYHLGDFGGFWRKKDRPIELWLSRLRGRIILIRGNHDEKSGSGKRLEELFAETYPYLSIKLYKQRINLCHYSFRTWRGMNQGAWHLHGHSHGALPPLEGSMDVGANCIGYRPISFEEVRERLGGFQGRSHH